MVYLRVCLLLFGFVYRALTVDLGCFHRQSHTGIPCKNRKTNEKFEMRVVGGEETKPHEYPFIVRIARGHKFICSGSIITSRHILTAGHCVEGGLDDPSSYDVTVGVHNWRKPTRNQKTYFVEKIIIHRFYENSFDDDISILLLKTKIKFSKHVARVCLPTSPFDIENKEVIVMGWGRDYKLFEHYSDMLRHATVKVITFDQCSVAWARTKSEIFPRQMCTLGNGKGVCSADSGGPIVFRDPDTKIFKQVGLNSYGKAKDTCGGEVPEVGTRVFAYMGFINNTIAATDPLPLRSCKKI